MDVSCAFLLRGLPGVEKGALIEIVKGVFGLPDSPRGWWRELREGDSWTSLKLDHAFFCLRDSSGHLIGMIFLATLHAPASWPELAGLKCLKLS